MINYNKLRDKCQCSRATNNTDTETNTELILSEVQTCQRLTRAKQAGYRSVLSLQKARKSSLPSLEVGPSLLLGVCAAPWSTCLGLAALGNVRKRHKE